MQVSGYRRIRSLAGLPVFVELPVQVPRSALCLTVA